MKPVRKAVLPVAGFGACAATNAAPNGPAPSDSSAAPWLADIERLKKSLGY